MSDYEISIPPQAYVACKIDKPFTKRPGLRQTAMDRIAGPEKKKFLQSLVRGAPVALDHGGDGLKHVFNKRNAPERPQTSCKEDIDSFDELYKVLRDSGDVGKANLPEWFEEKSKQSQRTPLFAISNKAGVLKEPKAVVEAVVEDVVDEKDANVDRLDANAEKTEKKTEKSKVFGASQVYGGIIVANNVPIVPYSVDTINAIGNHASSPFSTTVEFNAHKLLPGHMHINFNICYGKINLRVASVKIPLRDINNSPTSETHDREHVAALFDRIGIEHEVHTGAYAVTIEGKSTNVDIKFEKPALEKLADQGFPYGQGFQHDIIKVFRKKTFYFTFYTPEEWEDFQSWIDNLGFLRDHAHSDTLAPLKKNSGEQPINRKNFTLKLDEDIKFAPALMKFDDLDQFITIHGDAIAREHKWQEWANTELGEIRCHASLIPIGSGRIVVERENGEKVQKPLVYALTIHKTSNPELFDQLAPPLGTHVRIQAQLEYRRLERPTHDKTEEEIYRIIGSEMHKVIWELRVPPTAKDKRQQAEVDAITDSLKPFIVQPITDDRPKLAYHICYKIASELRRVRGNKKKEIQGETPQDHKARTLQYILKFPKFLRIPPSEVADIPELPGVRFSFGQPIGQAGSIQFLVKAPRYPNWPKEETIHHPAPFCDFKQQIQVGASMEETVGAVRRMRKELLIECKIVKVYSEDTARSQEKGVQLLKQHQDEPITNWLATFEGPPITADVTENFSVLKMVFWQIFYNDALPFRRHVLGTNEEGEPDWTEDKYSQFLYPKDIKDEDGQAVEMTTEEFQIREATVAAHMLSVYDSLTPNQREAFKLLSRTPFGVSCMEGVPGSGKTTVAKTIFAACIASSLNPTIRANQDMVEKKTTALNEADDEDSDEDLEPDDDVGTGVDAGVKFNMKPKLPERDDDNAKPEPKQEPETKTPWLSLFDFPALTLGPTVSQMEDIISKSGPLTPEEIIDEIRKVYTANCEIWKETRRPELVKKYNDKMIAKIFRSSDKRHNEHLEEWVARVWAAVTDDDTIDVLRKDPSTDDPALELEAAIADFEAQEGETFRDPVPQAQETRLQGMIIANQNVNGDDLAESIFKLHQELGTPVNVIRPYNLDRAGSDLMNSFRGDRPDYTEEAPSVADIIGEGVDDNILKDFANNLGDFQRRKIGGVYSLEFVMRSYLRGSKKFSNLKRQLQRLGNLDDPMTKDETKALKKSVNDLARYCLRHADIVVCTFHMAQVLWYKEMFIPKVVWIDEASREHEIYMIWVMLEIAPYLLLLTGDKMQDRPFCISTNVSPGNKDKRIACQMNVFRQQFTTPFAARLMECAPHHMARLLENFRQHGGLEELSSGLFYGGKMRSGLNPDHPLAKLWQAWAQTVITEHNKQFPPKGKSKLQAASFLTHNRLTYLCRSQVTMSGKSSKNPVQALRSVDWAAIVHQSGVPGTDGQRPTICIITPYSAQVEEINDYLRKLSPQEVVKSRVEVRTQPASTGAEWDIVINVFVRDQGMGFLADAYRMNVMWTRARLLNIDIMDIDWFEKPTGGGSHVIRRYGEETLRNGALIVDRRKWDANYCGVCFGTHPKGCKQDQKCTFCGGDHHARKCNSKNVMTDVIPADSLFVPKVDPESVRPADFTVTDIIRPNPADVYDEEEDAVPTQEEEEPTAREPDPEMEIELEDFMTEQGLQPLELVEVPVVQAIAEEEDIYGVSDDDDDVVNDTGRDVPKVNRPGKRRKAISLGTEKRGWLSVRAKQNEEFTGDLMEFADDDNTATATATDWNQGAGGDQWDTSGSGSAQPGQQAAGANWGNQPAGTQQPGDGDGQNAQPAGTQQQADGANWGNQPAGTQQPGDGGGWDDQPAGTQQSGGGGGW